MYKKRFCSIILIIIWCTTSAYYLRKKMILYSCPPLTSLSVLWQLKYQFCRDKSFVATNMLVATKVSLSGQNFCHNKIMFVITKYFCCNETFVRTNTCLSQQAYFCHDKTCFVIRNACLLRQKKACCDKTLVATKLCLP